MTTPLHPMIVHLPLVLTFVLPILILVFAMLIKQHKMTPNGWLLIIGLQIVVTGTGYISLETGETEEHTVEKVVSKKIIHEHEEAAEIFVGSTVLALVLSIAAFFLRKEFQFFLQMGIIAITLISGYLGYRTGVLGGELVFVHGAASAYTETKLVKESPSILPTSVEENESLNADDNDYGNDDGNVINDDERPEE